MKRAWSVAAALLLAGLGTGLGPAPLAAAAPRAAVVRTVPPIAGVDVVVDGTRTRTDAAGVAVLPVIGSRGLEDRLRAETTPISADLRVRFDRVIGSPSRGYTMGLRTERLISYSFAGPDKAAVDPARISRLELRSNTGETVSVSGAEIGAPLWLAASRTQQTPDGLISKDLYWTVTHVVVDGAEVVNRSQQKFVPNQLLTWTVKLLFYQVRVTATDALLGGPAGTGIQLHRPDGTTLDVPLVNGTATLTNVPRGAYQVRVTGGGLTFLRPVGISKDQELVLEVITQADIALVTTGIVAVALGLVLVGRRRQVAALGAAAGAVIGRRLREVHLPEAPQLSRPRATITGLVIMILFWGVVATPRASASEPRAPVLAYYYIWFNPTSWDRAKRDFPLLGRYSSADPAVMEQHIVMARSAGITGFLVSWKHTDFLDPRLDQLVEIARRYDFELGIVYQALDFQRRPLPAADVAAGLRYFADRYAGDPVFDLYGEPVVIVTGTEQYSVEQVRQIAEPVRSKLHVLASAKSVADYERTGGLVDGDAYYWSSADPATAAFRAKLAAMGAAVHRRGGLWLAPAPAGFDARDLGGHRVIDRAGGATLREAMDAAGASGADGISVISWNEFSENSHVEPSERYGATALQSLATWSGTALDLRGIGTDSSDPAPGGSGIPGWAAIALVIGGGLALAVVAVRLRRR